MSPRDPAPTIAAIMAAAETLLEVGGPDAVTLRAVGEAAGVSRMAPYRHFADKLALLHAVAERTLRDMALQVRQAAGAQGLPAEKLRAGCAAYLDSALERPHHYLLIFGNEPLAEPGPSLAAAADDAMDAIAEVVTAAQEAGVLRPAPTRELATTLWVLLHGLASLQLTGHLREPRTVEGIEGLDALLDLTLAQFSA